MTSIHQEITFDAPPSRVYKTLIDAGEFARFTGVPADISPEEGGAFICFGTFILGRNIELIPDKRIVQAWRVFNWAECVLDRAIRSVRRRWEDQARDGSHRRSRGCGGAYRQRLGTEVLGASP